MKKLIRLLNKIFAPRVTSTYYYNDKKVDKFDKEVQRAFDDMQKIFDKLTKL